MTPELYLVPIGAALVALFLAAWRWPLTMLTVLLLGLILHSAATLFGSNVLQLDDAVLVGLSAWKEAIIAGIALAGVRAAWRRRARPTLVQGLGLALLALIGLRLVVDLVVTSAPVPVVMGARSLGEFLVVFLAVSWLAPPLDWLRRTAWMLAPVLALIAVFAIVQPILGRPFYDFFFHEPGERLHHSYLVNLAGTVRPRAVGTYIAPNEFGLALVLYLMAVIGPLWMLGRRRPLLAISVSLMVVALLFSFSRSAWIGAAGAVLIGAVVAWGPLRGYLGWLFERPRQLLLPRVAVLLIVGAMYATMGGLTLVRTTLTGEEPSAAGRGDSIGVGVEASTTHPFGLGLGTAGPKAAALRSDAVLTENWYLVYSVQLGWVPLGVLLAFVAATVLALARRVRTAVRAGVFKPGAPPHEASGGYRFAVELGTFSALTAALLGALVIPALLDLPASITLWTLVAVVLGGGLERATRTSGAGAGGA